MSNHFCHYGGHEYDVLPQGGCCTVPTCFGEPLLPYPPSDPGVGPVEQQPTATLEGLCILVCDISASMDSPAYTNHPAEKLTQVVGAIQQAIGELQDMSKADTAYIAIVAFGERAGLILDANDRPFVKSISEIISEYGDRAENLGSYLYPYFQKDVGKFGRGGTNITAGLEVARAIYDCTLSGDLSPLGISVSSRLMEHSDIVTPDRQQLTMPNIRVMMYSDGGHAAKRPLANPFDALSPSPLMTAFIGSPTTDVTGASQMSALANICPEHQTRGYFLIDAPEKRATLRQLFRMASGASGFCERCLVRSVSEFGAMR